MAFVNTRTQCVTIDMLKPADRRPHVPDGPTVAQLEKLDYAITQLEHWQVRRAQRLRLRSVAIAVVIVLLAVGSAFSWQLQRRSVRREYRTLKYEAGNLTNAAHKAVAPLLEQVTLIEAERGNLSTADIARATRLLRQAIRISEGLDRSLPRRHALGIVLTTIPWVLQSPFIARRKSHLDVQYQELVDQLEEGRTDGAWQTLDTLQHSLAELFKDNIQAAQVCEAQSACDRLASRVSTRLKKVERFHTINRLAADGEAAWQEGAWDQAQALYGQAQQRLSSWLQVNETPEERIQRAQDNTDAFLAVEHQLDIITQERDESLQQVEVLQAELANAPSSSPAALRDLQQVLRRESEERKGAESTCAKRDEELFAVNTTLRQDLALARDELKATRDRLNTVERQLIHAKLIQIREGLKEIAAGYGRSQ